MPHIPIDPKSIPLVDPEIAETLPKIEFWRTASKSSFDRVFFRAMNEKVTEDKYLKRLDLESNASYNRRAMFVEDSGWSKKVINSYTGYFSKSKFELQTELSDELNESFLNNIDLQGTTHKDFIVSTLEELLTVGRVFCVVDAANIFEADEFGDIRLDNDQQPILKTSIPKAFFIKREDVMDFSLNETGEGFDWIKFKRVEKVEIGITKKFIQQIVIVDSELWSIAEEQKDGKWRVINEVPNNLGTVPIIKVDLGSTALPIINTVAKFQLNMMNFESEMRNTLSIQSLNLLQMSDEMAKGFERFTATSIISYPEGKPDRASWIAPPSATLDPHFRYLAWLVENLINVSNLKQKITRQVESAEAKAFDWLDVESVLNFASDAIEKCVKKVIRLFGKFKKEDVDPVFEIDREFLKDNVTELIDNALKADLLQLGSTALIKLNKKVRDKLQLGLTADERKISDEEIEKLLEDRINELSQKQDPEFDMKIEDEEFEKENIENAEN